MGDQDNHRDQQAVGEQISDEIVHALHHSWSFDPKTITMTAERGKVRLSGTVGSALDRRRAAVGAWSHPGVTMDRLSPCATVA